jgi:hypothetical protein
LLQLLQVLLMERCNSACMPASTSRTARLLLLLLLLLHVAWGRCASLLLRSTQLLLLLLRWLLLCVQLLQQVLALHVQLLRRQLSHSSSCALVQRACHIRAGVLRKLATNCCGCRPAYCC